MTLDYYGSVITITITHYFRCRRAYSKSKYNQQLNALVLKFYILYITNDANFVIYGSMTVCNIGSYFIEFIEFY